MMKKWDVDLCFGKSKTKINKFGVEIPFSAKDVPIVNIFDFTAKTLSDQWDRIPDHFKVVKNPPSLTLDGNHKTLIYRNGKAMTLESRIGKPPKVVHTADVLDESQ